MRVIVTGARGLLGSTLMRVLPRQGHEALEFVGDIAAPDAVARNTPPHGQVDAVIHTAALTNVNRCEQERGLCRRVNVEGTRTARDLAEKVNARFIHISTVSVFSGIEGNYREPDEPRPVNYYNITKRESELVALEYPRSLVLRLNLIGIHPDGSRGRNFLEWLYDTAKANRDMKLFTDVLINPLSNWTLAELMGQILAMNIPDQILHLGATTNLSKADIGRHVLQTFPAYSGKIEYVGIDDANAGPPRPKNMWLNIDRAIALKLPFPTLEDELRLVSSL
jgi:dTDP-4-dehydrorhamnose reductase